MAGLGSIGFVNIDDLAERAIARRAKEAEAFYLEALHTVEQVKWDYPPERVAERFKALPELMPDCLHELAYWNDLHYLRKACDTSGDYEHRMESSARDWFIFGLLAELRPRTREEAKNAFRYLMTSDRQDMPEAEQILENLVS